MLWPGAPLSFNFYVFGRDWLEVSEFIPVMDSAKNQSFIIFHCRNLFVDNSQKSFRQYGKFTPLFEKKEIATVVLVLQFIM